MVAWKYMGKYMQSIPNLRAEFLLAASKTLWSPPSSMHTLPSQTLQLFSHDLYNFCFQSLLQDLHVCYDKVPNHHNLLSITNIIHSEYSFRKTHENAWICLMRVTSHATLDSVCFTCLVSSKPNSASNSCNRRRLGKGGTCMDLAYHPLEMLAEIVHLIQKSVLWSV